MLNGILNSHTSRPDDTAYRNWLCDAMSRIEADYNRSSDTHLHRLDLPFLENVQIYLKDESIHLTGSLKHRLARSLFLYGLCSGRIGPTTTLIEASSGSTAVSEAYFAKLLGLPFVAVIPRGTSAAKIAEIARYGGRTVEVASADIYLEAERLERETGGYFLDQFTYAERATDWRSNNNIAESLFDQMALEPHPAPDWVVVGAGTGGTSATIGRYIRYQAKGFGHTRLCVADPENSVFFEGYVSGDRTVTEPCRSRIEGVGRPRVEPSFVPSVIDRMIRVSDAASFATVWWLKERTGRTHGPSTGLNVYASLQLALEMQAEGRDGAIATLICDDGCRYEDTCHDRAWLSAQGLDILPTLQELNALETGTGTGA